MPLFTIPFEKNDNQTLTYREAIGCYEKMAQAYPGMFHLESTGSTDIGEPLHVAVLNTSGEFDPVKIRRSGKRILLINNGIHPGEPEGAVAARLPRGAAARELKWWQRPEPPDPGQLCRE